MTTAYTHALHQEVLSISGSYELEKEERLAYAGRELLYIIGNAVVDTSCCGYGSFRYAVVPGFVVSWRSRHNEAGESVSEVEPISQEAIKQEIAKRLRAAESVNQVQFW